MRDRERTRSLLKSSTLQATWTLFVLVMSFNGGSPAWSQSSLTPAIATDPGPQAVAPSTISFADISVLPAPDAASTQSSAGKWTFFGSERLRVEDWNWFATPKASGAY